MTLPYDALLVVSFGGPEGMDDVMPFLENVLRGRNVPAERMQQVARQYELFGGVSPINEQNRRLVAAVAVELEAQRLPLPVYWGNRNWRPLLPDTLARMAADGVRRALALVTSAYSSYSGCRQYLEDIERARAEVGERAPVIEKLRAFFNHPGFVEVNAGALRAALSGLPERGRADALTVFTAHSIPAAMAATCSYEAELREVCRLVAREAGVERFELAYQSRSGPPTQPWLEPDVRDRIRELPGQGVKGIVLAPVGFISDHMEVVYDLDTDAAGICSALGIEMVRAATAGVHPRFVRMVAELVRERVDGLLPAAVGELPPAPDRCPASCCAYQPARPLAGT